MIRQLLFSSHLMIRDIWIWCYFFLIAFIWLCKVGNLCHQNILWTLTCVFKHCYAETKSEDSSSTFYPTSFDTPAAINLKPPPIDRQKSFDEDNFSKRAPVKKASAAVPINVKSYSIADLQMATGSFNVDNLLGEGSFGRVYRAEFDDGKVTT